MRNFREFLIEIAASTSAPPVGRLSQKGYYGFEDMHDLADPERAPVGGWQSYAQKASAEIQKKRKTGPNRELWAAKDILVKIQFCS